MTINSATRIAVIGSSGMKNKEKRLKKNVYFFTLSLSLSLYPFIMQMKITQKLGWVDLLECIDKGALKRKHYGTLKYNIFNHIYIRCLKIYLKAKWRIFTLWIKLVNGYTLK